MRLRSFLGDSVAGGGCDAATPIHSARLSAREVLQVRCRDIILVFKRIAACNVDLFSTGVNFRRFELRIWVVYNGSKIVKISTLFFNPRKALLTQLTVFYGLLSLLVWALSLSLPDIAGYLYSWEPRVSDLTSGEVFESLGQAGFRALQVNAASALFVSIIGALLLMIPVSWVYMGTRRRSGLDQSMVESLLMLPIAVAGVVVIVQDSIPLAFSLAGIFAGIQFRSRLKYYADAHFIFIAIGVGLAAGIGALHIAAVMSLCFSYIAYFIWRMGYGAEAAERHLRYPTAAARDEAGRRREAIHQHTEDEDDSVAADFGAPDDD